MLEKYFKTKYSYIKFALFLCLLLFIIVTSSGGGISEKPINAVGEKVAKTAGYEYNSKAPKRMFKRYYGLDESNYKGVVYFAPNGNMDANELLIIKLDDLSQQQEVEEAIKNRISNQKKSFEGYAPKQYALVKNGVYKIKGNYAFFMIGKDADKCESVFENIL